jgi:hypothetical protein
LLGVERGCDGEEAHTGEKTFHEDDSPSSRVRLVRRDDCRTERLGWGNELLQGGRSRCDQAAMMRRRMSYDGR